MPEAKASKSNARMDASKAAQLEECIKKEERIMRRFLEAQQKAGLISVQQQAEPVTPQARTLEKPRLLCTVQGDPEACMDLNISRALWQGPNSGYQLRDGFALQSTMKSEFVWDQAEIDFMKQQHYLDKTFNRRRDEQTLYAEESCKFKHMGKSKAAQAKP